MTCIHCTKSFYLGYSYTFLYNIYIVRRRYCHGACVQVNMISSNFCPRVIMSNTKNCNVVVLFLSQDMVVRQTEGMCWRFDCSIFKYFSYMFVCMSVCLFSCIAVCLLFTCVRLFSCQTSSVVFEPVCDIIHIWVHLESC